MKTYYGKRVLTVTITGADAYFDVIVEEEWCEYPLWEIDHNCDSFNKVNEKTGKAYVSVIPTDKFHNVNNDYETLTEVLPVDLARKVIVDILNDDNDLMWFTKDRIRYAAKHGDTI